MPYGAHESSCAPYFLRLFLPAVCQCRKRIRSAGVHKLTNTSETENLVYIDFAVIRDLDVAAYPDSKKIGVWSKNVNRRYPLYANVEHFAGE